MTSNEIREEIQNLTSRKPLPIRPFTGVAKSATAEKILSGIRHGKVIRVPRAEKPEEIESVADINIE